MTKRKDDLRAEIEREMELFKAKGGIIEEAKGGRQPRPTLRRLQTRHSDVDPALVESAMLGSGTYSGRKGGAGKIYPDVMKKINRENRILRKTTLGRV